MVEWKLREGNGNPLQCFCLENPKDGRAWWAAISGVAQSRTWLKWVSSSSSSSRVKTANCLCGVLHSSVQLSSVTQSCPTLCDPVDCSMPGFSVHHQLLEPTHRCPSSRCCHLTISASVVPFCSRLQSFLKVRWVYNSNKHLRWFQCSLKCNNHFYEINVLFSWKPSFKSLTQKLVFVTKNMDITLSLFYS